MRSSKEESPGTTQSRARTTWFITGSSTGLGRALTEVLLAEGYSVAATARNPSALESLRQKFGDQLLCPVLDVTQPSQVRSAVTETLAHFGQIDVVVNNAGYGLIGAIEEVTDSEIRAQMNTNFFGALDVIRVILPQFRKKRSGHFLNISSIAGFRATAGAGIYTASKFALEGLSEALAKEVAHLGIHVTIVEPGPFRTDFGGRSIVDTKNNIDDYVPSVGQMREYYKNAHGHQAGDPTKAARAMIQLVESGANSLRLPLGPATLKGMREKMDQVNKDIAHWEDVAIKTSFSEE